MNGNKTIEPGTIEPRNEEGIKDIKIIPECPTSISGTHQWRIVPDFFNESGGRDVRVYTFYCVRCLTTNTAKISRG